MVKPEDFGAIGDGIANDTIAVQTKGADRTLFLNGNQFATVEGSELILN